MTAVLDDGLRDGLGDRLGDLDAGECRKLLARACVGRVGFTLGSLPAIVPVRYALIDGDIVFELAGGARVRAAMHGAVVAFEVDAADDRGTSWSVLAVGCARELESSEARALAVDHDLEAGSGDERGELVRVHPELLSGRPLTVRP